MVSNPVLGALARETRANALVVGLSACKTRFRLLHTCSAKILRYGTDDAGGKHVAPGYEMTTRARVVPHRSNLRGREVETMARNAFLGSPSASSAFLIVRRSRGAGNGGRVVQPVVEITADGYVRAPCENDRRGRRSHKGGNASQMRKTSGTDPGLLRKPLGQYLFFATLARCKDCELGATRVFG